MASQNFDATDDPRALETVLNLTDGQQYYVQNVDSTARLRLRAAAVQPAASMRAHFVEPGGNIIIKPEPGISTWAWTDSPEDCACIVTDSP